ncbi:hypothetical protein [Pseudonocardia sediminis]|uniref:hypothetical protein n=1 Tax=Pseudonocardia sediminis TaxID=1397368 RepID=UPI001F5FAA3F|nr:hypothetical protein [Pseudonocardia sediminis]
MSQPPMSQPPVSEEPAPSCLICATVAGSPGTAALTWVRERDEHGRERWLCPPCARRHVRDIEAKLSHEWW